MCKTPVTLGGGITIWYKVFCGQAQNKIIILHPVVIPLFSIVLASNVQE
jgi:hypothetical protein